MTKLFKNSKQVLAFVFAFAVLAVSLFTGSININADACDVSKIDYWDGTRASNFAGGDGSETNPYIIKTAEQLAYACLGQTPDASTGKYYKVDDSVRVFVMQPENVVDLDTLLAFDSAEAVKDYLTGLSGVKNWISQFNGQSFNGNFDGNYATIYGLYADGVDANREDVGLFPQYDGGTKVDGVVTPTTCKNITVKNSYYKTKRRLGAITGAAYGIGYGAKVDGKVMVDTCAVINCYMEGTAANINHYSEEGIVVGGGNGDVIQINSILVKGTYAFDIVQSKNIPIIGSASNSKIPDPADATKSIYQTKVTNSVFLGVAPYQKDYYVDHLCQEYIFTNVVTDAATGKVTIQNPAGWASPSTTREYAEDQIKQVTATGFDFVAETSTLDWENTWFMSDNGPELRAFHGEIAFESTTTTHVWSCVDCGMTSPGGVAEHDFALVGDAVVGDGTDVYVCSACGYTCQHNEQTDIEYDPGNCITASGYYAKCKFCDWYIVSGQGDVPGHKFTYVAADPGHCEKNGHLEYWECSVCNNKFTSDDIYASMDTAVTDADLDTGLGTHIKAEDDNGTIVLYDKDGHWYTCEVDGGRLDSNSNVIGESEVIKHKYKNAVCVDCGYRCSKHDYELTGNIAVIGDCFTDEEAEIKCNICGFKSSAVTVAAGHKIVKKDEVKPNDKTEGTKAHYKCEECNAIFADAEGKTPITKASLVIPKTLPAEYDVLPENADTSSKSPATGDSVASVLAVVALAGATLLIGRKK